MLITVHSPMSSVIHTMQSEDFSKCHLQHCMQVGLPKSGYAEVFLFEYFAGVNYDQFLQLLNRFHSEKHTNKVALLKEKLRDLACSD